jgi:hypothetical protein
MFDYFVNYLTFSFTIHTYFIFYSMKKILCELFLFT